MLQRRERLAKCPHDFCYLSAKLDCLTGFHVSFISFRRIWIFNIRRSDIPQESRRTAPKSVYLITSHLDVVEIDHS